MTEGLTPLQITEDIRQIVREYITRQPMPADPSGDALHLAIASYYGCDFLAIWNCQHLANANKSERIAQVNVILGLAVPALVTPLELMGAGLITSVGCRLASRDAVRCSRSPALLSLDLSLSFDLSEFAQDLFVSQQNSDTQPTNEKADRTRALFCRHIVVD